MQTQDPIVRSAAASVHLKVLGWIHIILGLAGLMAGTFALYALYGGSTIIPQETKDLLAQAGYLSGLLWLFLGVAGISVVTGFGLLKAAQWAKYILWFFAIISLLDFPFGTAFGAYAIWALTRKNGAFSY